MPSKTLSKFKLRLLIQHYFKRRSDPGKMSLLHSIEKVNLNWNHPKIDLQTIR